MPNEAIQTAIDPLTTEQELNHLLANREQFHQLVLDRVRIDPARIESLLDRVIAADKGVTIKLYTGWLIRIDDDLESIERAQNQLILNGGYFGHGDIVATAALFRSSALLGKY